MKTKNEDSKTRTGVIQSTFPYTDPRGVTTPRGRIRDLEVLYNGGAQADDSGWSLASMLWDGEEALGIRWNGGAEGDSKGQPTSRGYPTWYILPQEVMYIFQEDREKAHAALDELLNTIYGK